MRRMMRQDGVRTSGLDAGPLPGGGAFLLDLLHQAGDPCLTTLRREIPPARQGLEGQSLRRRVLETVELLSLPAGHVLLGPVEPQALQDLAVEEGSHGVDPRPVPEALDQILFCSRG
jgi:hypothetical protein